MICTEKGIPVEFIFTQGSIHDNNIKGIIYNYCSNRIYERQIKTTQLGLRYTFPTILKALLNYPTNLQFYHKLGSLINLPKNRKNFFKKKFTSTNYPKNTIFFLCYTALLIFLNK